jgi:hypothetical protein
MRRTDKLTAATKKNKIRRLKKHIKLVSVKTFIDNNGKPEVILTCNDENAKEKLAILEKL